MERIIGMALWAIIYNTYLGKNSGSMYVKYMSKHIPVLCIKGPNN